MSVPIFLTGTLQVLKGFNNVSSEPSFLQAELPQLFQPFLSGEVLQSFDQQQSLLWTCSSRSMSFLCWGSQSWMQHCTGFSSEQSKGTESSSLPCFPTGLWMQLRTLLFYWAVSAHCGLLSSPSHSRAPSPSPEGCL